MRAIVVNLVISALQRLLSLVLLLALFTGCAPAVRPKHQQTVDVKAQKVYYDQGLKHYSREEYRASQEDFQKVVDNGPNTDLGLKAKENLKKLQQILKTIEHIQSK
jgi:outer membrane protein assembly factor BamD (BamD/ComL family)